MSKVYITQQPYGGKNLEPAKKFGSLHIILRHNDTMRGCDYSRVLQCLERELADFTEDDYLLNLGDPHATGMAYGILMDKMAGNVKLLKWIRKTQE